MRIWVTVSEMDSKKTQNMVKNMTMSKKIYTTFLLFFVLHNLIAQTDSLQHKFDEHQKKHLQEKLFVHTDKNIYLAGEILWFKMYDVDAFFHLPVHFSGIAYV